VPSSPCKGRRTIQKINKKYQKLVKAPNMSSKICLGALITSLTIKKSTFYGAGRLEAINAPKWLQNISKIFTLGAFFHAFSKMVGSHVWEVDFLVGASFLFF